MKNILQVAAALVTVVLLSGCTFTAGGKPMLGLETEKDKEGKPVSPFGTVITVHQYGYGYAGGGVQPQPTPPGTPPTPPIVQAQATILAPPAAAIPPRPTYSTVFATNWADPTLVIIRNESQRFVRLRIDDAAEEIPLPPYSSTPDFSLAFGEHRIMATIEVPTAAFGTPAVERPYFINIRPDGRPQVIQIFGW